MVTQPKTEPKSMGINVWGPLLSWSVMFAISVAIKVIAFDNSSVWFEIPPEATLWAVGALFTITAADSVLSRAKFLPKYKKKSTGLGYEVDYEVTLPDSFDLTSHSKYLYTFLMALGAWIFNVFLSGLAIAETTTLLSLNQTTPLNLKVYVLFFVSAIIAVITVVTTIRLLNEVSK